MQYDIVSSDTKDGLVNEVNKLMNNWSPVGGVSVVHFQWENDRKCGRVEDEFTYYQAIVKKTEEDFYERKS